MTYFHIPTVFLILGLLYLLLPTLTWLVLADRQSRPICLWCGGGIAMGVGVILVALRGQLPAWATFPLAALMIFLYMMMQIQSMRIDPYRLKVLHQGEAETAVEHSCTATIGLTLFFGVEDTQDAIFKRADQTMYQAKEKGRNRVQVYKQEIISSQPSS